MVQVMLYISTLRNRFPNFQCKEIINRTYIYDQHIILVVKFQTVPVLTMGCKVQ